MSSGAPRGVASGTIEPAAVVGIGYMAMIPGTPKEGALLAPAFAVDGRAFTANIFHTSGTPLRS